jgi:hypothetical protein
MRALLIVVLALVVLPSGADAKRKRAKAPAETMSKQEKCCYEIGAIWKPALNACWVNGGGGTQYGFSPRDMTYDACLARK